MKKIKIKPALVKICGITNSQDALWAANLGADFVGLNFCSESSRKISVDKAAEIQSSLPPFIKTVGVFVQEDLGAIEKILKKVKLNFLQFHGLEDAAYLEAAKNRFALPIWKAVHVQDESSLQKISEVAEFADAIILDSHHPTQMGGTGQTFDWKLAAGAKQLGVPRIAELPIILSGGLNPQNVREAISIAEPWCVDAASGVEKTGHPRKKDIEKMKEFILESKN